MVSLWRPELPGAETLDSGAASAAAGTLCFGLPLAFSKRGDSAAGFCFSGSACGVTTAVTTTSAATGASGSTGPGAVDSSELFLSFWCPGASPLFPGGSVGGAASADPHGSSSAAANTAIKATFCLVPTMLPPLIPLKGHTGISPPPEG